MSLCGFGDRGRGVSQACADVRPSLGVRLSILIATVLLALEAFASPLAAQRGQSVLLRPMGTVEGVTSVDHFCRRPVMDALLGEPLAQAGTTVPKAVNAYSMYFQVLAEDGKSREPLYLGVYSFEDIRFILNRGPGILETFGIQRARAVLKDVRSCPPVFTAGDGQSSSLPHSNLLKIGQVSTPQGPRIGIVPVAALFMGLAKAQPGGDPPPVAALPKPDVKQPPAPRQGDASPPDRSTGGRRPSTDDPLGRQGALPGPDRGVDPSQPKVLPGDQSPVIAPPAPRADLAPKAAPADPLPPAQAQAAELFEEQTALCAKGDQIACMIAGRLKTRAQPPAPKSEPPKDQALPQPQAGAPKTAAAKPDAPPAPAQAADPVPAPKLAVPPPPKADVEPKALKQAKRYPAPAYPVIEQAIAPISKGQRAPFEALVVESVECSDEGNWLVAFIGVLTEPAAGKARLAIMRRIALNNYPTEGRVTRDELKAAPLGLDCAPDGIACAVPKKRISLAEHRSHFGDGAGGNQNPGRPASQSVGGAGDWRCAPEQGVCYSKQSDPWRCEIGHKHCVSFDEARWWCVPRREFCFQGVPFGDWGSPFKEGDVLNVRLEPARDAAGVLVKDANGHVVYENHVYPMALGVVRIAQDVLMRRCGGYAGPARGWQSTFPTN